MNGQYLVNALREHAEWAQANEWKTPITLGDDLAEAADRIANQSAHIVTHWMPLPGRPEAEKALEGMKDE